MPKVDIKQPVVSKKLAEDFECIANEKGRAATHNINNYVPIENYGINNILDMQETITEMYILGYKIEKSKIFHICLRSLRIGILRNFLNLNLNTGVYSVGTSGEKNYVKTQFTQEEVDDFLEVEPKDMWFVVEVVEVKD